ncbi:unnamed protein product [Rhizophagus irregularis]|nr:unnamed protein product [Rhizophagus irregularis]
MSLSKISNYKDDEDHKSFLKEFLKEFYRQIIKIENYKNYDDILMNWMKDFYYTYNNYYNIKNLNYNNILKLMEEHKENENWFSGLIGFFYEYGIIIVNKGNNNNNNNKINKILIDKNKSLNLYLLSIKKYNNDKKKNLVSIYQLINIIISKYLLSLYYYKDIIIDKKNLNSKESKRLMSSYNPFENFNGLKINLCKDEINSMEKYFGSINKYSDDYNNNKTKELMNLNNLGVEKDETKALEYYEKSAEKGYVNAQNNLGFLYITNEGTKKDLEKAIHWFHKAADNGDEVAYDNLGFRLYDEAEKGNNHEIDLFDEVIDDLNEVKYWYQRLEEIDNKLALYKLGEIYELGKGVNQNEIRAFDFYKKAAEKGCINGKYKLAYYFLHGIIVDVDIEKAFNLYKKAAEGGINEAHQKILELLNYQGE